MSGFAALYRKATEHPLFKGDSARLGAWCWLIMKACWKPTRFNINGKTITLDRGQYCCSVRELAEVWGWSKSSVDRFLTRLKTETMIETESGTGRLIITICKYEEYQNVEDEAGTPTGTPTGTAAGQQRDTKEQENHRTIEPNGSSDSPPTPHRDRDWPQLPGWLPAEQWNAWLAMRKKQRKWPTKRAVELALADLGKWRAKGHDPGSILDRSTMNNWTGIFEPKDDRNGNRGTTDRTGSPRTGSAGGGFKPAAGFQRRAIEARSGETAAQAGRRDDRSAGSDDELPLAPARFLPGG